MDIEVWKDLNTLAAYLDIIADQYCHSFDDRDLR